jgi:VWFA-related protein
MRTCLLTGAALLLALGTNGVARPAASGAQRGLWRGLVEATVFAATREGGQQQPAKPAQPPAQPQPADPAAQPPVFRAGINYVRVDVIISDKNGNPVADLQASDFDVSEDGKPQKIDTFKLIKLDGGTAESMKEPPKEIRNDFDEESEAARDDVRLFAIFLDDYHVRRGASMAVRGQLAKFIDTQIGPSDMVGVMYPLEATGSVRMTRNHSAVSRGLQGFLGRKYEYEPKNQFEEQYAHYPTETVERVRNQVSLSALKALIIHMGSLKEGRKSLILVSEGYTYMVPPQMRNADAQQPGSGNPNTFNSQAGQNDINEDRAAWSAGLEMDSDLREIYDTANRNNVAIYAVDPRGLPGFEFDINEGVGLQTDTKYLTSTMDSLRSLAENTDGRAIVNRNDIAAGMKQITRDSSAYYLIGYNSLQAPTDGKFHEIKVKVKRPGVQVRARRGYWALNREEVARATAPAKPAVPKPVEVAIANAVVRASRASVMRSWVGMSRGENGKTRVTFIWEPLPKAPGDRPREEPARVSLMAIAPDGSPSFRGKVPDVALVSAAPAAAATTGGAPAGRGPSRVSFDVNPGKIQLRISVEGSAAQVLDSETREISVPDLTSAQATMGTASVLRARTAREFQQLRADGDAVPITGREFSRIEHLLVRVPTYGPGGTTPTLRVHLLNRAGAAMNELKAEPAPRTGEQQIDLPLAGLPPGEYVLEIKAGDQDGEATELVGFRVTG